MEKLLQEIKEDIEFIYKVDPIFENVTDCMINDKTYNLLIKKRKFVIDNCENEGLISRVLLYELEEENGISVYFSDKFKKRFKKYDPRKIGIKRENFPLIRAMIEEMDHLVFTCYLSQEEREIKHFDMELQANVTKYVLGSSMFSLKQGTFPNLSVESRPVLKNLLFYLDFLIEDPKAKSNYERAAVVGRAYSHHLDKIDSCFKRLSTLREFYRMDPDVKKMHIMQL